MTYSKNTSLHQIILVILQRMQEMLSKRWGHDMEILSALLTFMSEILSHRWIFLTKSN